MRSIWFVILLLAIAHSIGGCNPEKKLQRKAEKAFILYAEGDKLDAARSFLHLARLYPNSSVYYKNLYNAAYIFQEIDSAQQALDAYHEILMSDANDLEKDSSRNIGTTHTNYKFYSAYQSGNIHLAAKEFHTALSFYKRCKTRFLYVSDSAWSIKGVESQLDMKVAQAYLGIEAYDSALCSVLPHALTKSPWSTNKPKTLAIQMVKSKMSPSHVLAELDQGFDSLNRHPGFVELYFKQILVPIKPYAVSPEAITAEQLRKTAFYIDLYRTVNP